MVRAWPLQIPQVLVSPRQRTDRWRHCRGGRQALVNTCGEIDLCLWSIKSAPPAIPFDTPVPGMGMASGHRTIKITKNKKICSSGQPDIDCLNVIISHRLVTAVAMKVSEWKSVVIDGDQYLFKEGNLSFLFPGLCLQFFVQYSVQRWVSRKC